MPVACSIFVSKRSIITADSELTFAAALLRKDKRSSVCLISHGSTTVTTTTGDSFGSVALASLAT